MENLMNAGTKKSSEHEQLCNELAMVIMDKIPRITIGEFVKGLFIRITNELQKEAENDEIKAKQSATALNNMKI
jgi:hypothetical protein